MRYMIDARFSGGSVGLVIGHVSPEAALGGPIALIEDGDTIVVDVKRDTINCTELEGHAATASTARRARWEAEADRNWWNASARVARRHRDCSGGCALQRLPPLQGAGLSDVGTGASTG